MIAYHLVRTANAGWIALWIAAIFNGIEAREYGTFMIVTAAMMLTMDVLWWVTGHSLVRPMAMQTAPVPSVTELDTLSAVKPEDIFGLWASASLHPDATSEFTGSDAYEHYSRDCAVNGVQPLSSQKFGDLLTKRADASGGAIIKLKSGGKMMYRGWRLAGASGEIGQDAAYVE